MHNHSSLPASCPVVSGHVRLCPVVSPIVSGVSGQDWTRTHTILSGECPVVSGKLSGAVRCRVSGVVSYTVRK